LPRVADDGHGAYSGSQLDNRDIKAVRVEYLINDEGTHRHGEPLNQALRDPRELKREAENVPHLFVRADACFDRCPVLLWINPHGRVAGVSAPDGHLLAIEVQAGDTAYPEKLRNCFPAVVDVEMAVAARPADLVGFQEVLKEAVDESIQRNDTVRPAQGRWAPALANALAQFPAS